MLSDNLSNKECAMNRRLHSLSRDPLYFIFLTLFLILFHIDWEILINLNIKLYPLAFIILLFVGYKYGKVNCALATFIAFLSYIAIKLYFNNDLDTDINEHYRLFLSTEVDFDEIVLVGQSIWSFVTLASLALIATAIIDLFERYLQTAKVSVDELLPYERSFYLIKLISFCHYFLVTKNDEVSVDAEMNIDLPYGIKINLKVLFKQVLLLLSFPLIFIISLNISMDIGDYIQIQFLPYYSAVIILLVFAWFRGFTQTLWLTVLLVIASFIAQATIEDGMLTDSIYFDSSFSNLSLAIITLIAAWWVCMLKTAFSTPKLKRRLFRLKLFRNLKKSTYKMHYFPIGCVLLLFLFSLELQVETSALTLANMTTEIKPEVDRTANNGSVLKPDSESVERIEVTGANNISRYIIYNSLFILAAFCLYFCSKYNPYSISNTLLILLSIQSCFSIFLDDFFEKTQWFNAFLYNGNAIEILILATIPIYFRFISMVTLFQYRVFFYSLTFALMFINMFASQLHKSFIISTGTSSTDILISLLLHIVLVELMIRGLRKILASKDV
jgi:hypothetical protein